MGHRVTARSCRSSEESPTMEKPSFKRQASVVKAGFLGLALDMLGCSGENGWILDELGMNLG